MPLNQSVNPGTYKDVGMYGWKRQIVRRVRGVCTAFYSTANEEVRGRLSFQWVHYVEMNQSLELLCDFFHLAFCTFRGWNLFADCRDGFTDIVCE